MTVADPWHPRPKRPAAPLPCPAEQPVAYFDARTTNGITKAALRCILTRGHEGNHVCNAPDGRPYEFPGS